ncbi:MAG: AMP-binding protein [Clostridia bacterium]|nr:AMP-binding protein [Clostridia bacterium]
MHLKNIGNARSVNEYVKKKLERFDQMGISFESLFELMFSEKDNILSETYSGLKVIRKTYGECQREILMLSDHILSGAVPGLSESVTCGIYMSNSVLWIEVFWALIISGINPLLMNLMIPPDELDSILDRQKVDFVICDSEDAPGRNHIIASKLYDDALMRTRELSAAVCNERGSSRGCDERGCFRGCDEPGKYSGFDERRKSRGFAEFIILMTSGTSQNIKLCCFDAAAIHDQISYSFEIIRKNRLIKKHFRGELKHLCFLPFYHIFGLVAVYIWFSFYSRSFVFLKDLRPDTLLDTVRLRHVTHIFAVPLFWDKIYESAVKTVKDRNSYGRLEKAFRLCDFLYSVPLVGNAAGTLFSRIAFREVRDNLFGDSICFLISGGGAIRPEVLRFFNYIGYRLVNGYGMTETGISCVELRPQVRKVIKGSVGHTMRCVTHRIDGDGILWIKGNIMARVIVENGVPRGNDEWFKTNDLAREENGYYWIDGRADDVIVLPDGENLNPNIAEKYFTDTGLLDLCIVKGLSEGAVLVGQIGKGAGAAEIEMIRDKVKETVAKRSLTGRITEIILTEAELMPKSDFKVSRSKIRSKLISGEIADVLQWSRHNGPEEKSAAEAASNSREGAAPDQKAPEGAVGLIADDADLRTAAEIFAEVIGIEAGEVKPATDFFKDLGGTSLDYYQMISLLEERFGTGFTETEGRRFTTGLSILEYLREARADAK